MQADLRFAVAFRLHLPHGVTIGSLGEAYCSKHFICGGRIIAEVPEAEVIVASNKTGL